VRSSVVVVSHRPTEWLDRCLGSVADQADELVVVDNGSQGHQATEAARRHGARVVRLQVNAGFSGGADAGFEAATGDLVAVLNDDAVASSNWLASAADLLADPSVAAVGPKIRLEGKFAEIRFDDRTWFSPGDPRPLGRQLSSVRLAGEEVLPDLLGVHEVEHGGGRTWRWTAGESPVYVRVPEGAGAPEQVVVDGSPVPVQRLVTLVNSAGVYLRGDGYAGDIGDSVPDEGQFDELAERFAVTGAAIVTRAATLARLGLFARRYFAYYEDTDWCWRAQLAGLHLVYDPTATITHVRGQTSGGTAAARVRYLSERNRLLTLLRNAPLRMAWSEVEKKRTGRGDDGVAEQLWRWVPAGLMGRTVNRRKWARTPREVFDRWAGVNVPG
jgi:N-acetylglucosaminyl-diphospho-decaprenol L-rhamnosyltransferase